MTDFNSYMGNIDTDFFRELCLRNGELRYYKRTLIPQHYNLTLFISS